MGRVIIPTARHRAGTGARVRSVIGDRTFWRDFGTLAGIVFGGIALAAGIWFYVLGFWSVA